MQEQLPRSGSGQDEYLAILQGFNNRPTKIHPSRSQPVISQPIP